MFSLLFPSYYHLMCKRCPIMTALNNSTRKKASPWAYITETPLFSFLIRIPKPSQWNYLLYLKKCYDQASYISIHFYKSEFIALHLTLVFSSTFLLQVLQRLWSVNLLHQSTFSVCLSNKQKRFFGTQMLPKSFCYSLYNLVAFCDFMSHLQTFSVRYSWSWFTKLRKCLSTVSVNRANFSFIHPSVILLFWLRVSIPHIVYSVDLDLSKPQYRGHSHTHIQRLEATLL